MKGLIFGGACVRREICVSKSIGLACSGEEIYHFCFVFTLYSRANSKYKPPGCTYIRRGNLTEGFLRYDLGGLYLEGLVHGGAYFQNFVQWLVETKHFPESKTCPKLQNDFPKFKKTLQIQNTSQNSKATPRI